MTGDQIRTADQRYLVADQRDGNLVVYEQGIAVWDRRSYEASLPAPASSPPPQPTISSGSSRVIRVTDTFDGEFVNRGYSYWPQAWIGPDGVYVFAGHVDNWPRFFRVDLASGTVERLGILVPYQGTAEGWYWDRSGSVTICSGPRLRRVNPFSGHDLVVFDITETHPGCRLWQAHSSDNGLAHSATVQELVEEGAYPNLGTVVFRNDQETYFAAQQSLDESQITPDGDWLVIKEGKDNRIIHLPTGSEQWIRDAQGAVGHSDCGPGFIVGEDDQHGACVRWDLGVEQSQSRVLFPTWNMGHVSVRELCLLSDGRWLSLVPLTGGEPRPLIEHGMVSDGTYDTQVFANLDPTGQIACYVSNAAGRMDLYVLVLP